MFFSVLLVLLLILVPYLPRLPYSSSSSFSSSSSSSCRVKVKFFAASNRRHNNFVAIAYLCSQRVEGGRRATGEAEQRRVKRIRANFWACYPFFYWFWFRSVLLTFVRQQFDFIVPSLCLSPSPPESLGLLRLGHAVGNTTCIYINIYLYITYSIYCIFCIYLTAFTVISSLISS